MREAHRRYSAALFGLALICFFLPFVNVSCQGQKIASFTGIQLVLGTTIEQPDMFGGSRQVEKVDGELLAILALVSGIAGLGLSFLTGTKRGMLPAIAAATGLVLLLLLKAKVDNLVLREAGGVLQVEYGVGFWLVLLLYLCAAGLNAFVVSQKRSDDRVQHIGASRV